MRLAHVVTASSRTQLSSPAQIWISQVTVCVVADSSLIMKDLNFISIFAESVFDTSETPSVLETQASLSMSISVAPWVTVHFL